MERKASMRKSAIGLAVGALLLLAACGGNGDGAPSAGVTDDGSVREEAELTPTPTVDPIEFSAAAQEAAELAVLTLDDFPPGWTREPAEDDGADDETDLKLSEECEILNQDSFPGEIASAESDDFTGPDDQEVSSGAAVFLTEDAAQDALDEFESAIQRCRSELRDEFERLAREGFEEGAGGVVELSALDASLSDLSFPLGKSSAAFRVTVAGSVGELTFELSADFVIFREGKMLGGFIFLALGRPGIEEEQRLAELTAGKLEQANASLPQ